MSSIVKIKNKTTGITYVYESESYWDKEKKQPRNHRTLIGKLDENGEVVPTGKRGRPKKAAVHTPEDQKVLDASEENAAMYRHKLMEAQAENADLRRQIQRLTREKQEILSALKKIMDSAGTASDAE